MQLKNNKNSYGYISIVFHWVIAALVIGMFALGLWMVELDYYSIWYHDAPNIHKSVGILLMIGMFLRLLWNAFSPKPKALEKSQVLKAIAFSVHLVLYLLVFLLGLTGYLISTAESQALSVFNGFELPALIEPFVDQADIAGVIHKWLGYILIGLVALHALGALKHHLKIRTTL